MRTKKVFRYFIMISVLLMLIIPTACGGGTDDPTPNEFDVGQLLEVEESEETEAEIEEVKEDIVNTSTRIQELVAWEAPTGYVTETLVTDFPTRISVTWQGGFWLDSEVHLEEMQFEIRQNTYSSDLPRYQVFSPELEKLSRDGHNVEVIIVPWDSKPWFSVKYYIERSDGSSSYDLTPFRIEERQDGDYIVGMWSKEVSQFNWGVPIHSSYVSSLQFTDTTGFFRVFNYDVGYQYGGINPISFSITDGKVTFIEDNSFVTEQIGITSGVMYYDIHADGAPNAILFRFELENGVLNIYDAYFEPQN